MMIKRVRFCNSVHLVRSEVRRVMRRAAGALRGPHGETAPELAHLHALGSLHEAEIGRWLASRPVFVSAARYEPFGLGVLEAATAG